MPCEYAHRGQPNRARFHGQCRYCSRWLSPLCHRCGCRYDWTARLGSIFYKKRTQHKKSIKKFVKKRIFRKLDACLCCIKFAEVWNGKISSRTDCETMNVIRMSDSTSYIASVWCVCVHQSVERSFITRLIAINCLWACYKSNNGSHSIFFIHIIDLSQCVQRWCLCSGCFAHSISTYWNTTKCICFVKFVLSVVWTYLFVPSINSTAQCG